MTQKQPLLQETLCIKNILRHLPAHFQNGSCGGFSVVRRMGIGNAEVIVPIFKIGQIDIHQAIQHA